MTANPPRAVRRLAQRRGKPARAQPPGLGLHDPDTRGRHHDMTDVPRAAERLLHVMRKRAPRLDDGVFDEVADPAFRVPPRAP